jgi:hypothetical protein
MESKHFEMEVGGGAAGLRIRGRCRGSLRSILQNRNETAWLNGSFEKLVAVRDSRVFWNQSSLGYPRILAQRHSNRHGYFLVLEEFEGGRRTSSVLMPEGKFGVEWTRFAFELCLAKDFVHTGQDGGYRKEVLCRGSGRDVTAVDKCFGAPSELLTRVPSWLRDSTKKSSRVTAKNQSKLGTHAPTKVFRTPAKSFKVPAKPTAWHPPVLGEKNQKMPVKTVFQAKAPIENFTTLPFQ